MNRQILILLGGFILFSISCSQNKILVENNQTHKEAVIELVNLIDMKTTLDESVKVLLDIQIQQNPSLENYRNTMLKFFKKYMSWESMEADYVKLYQEEFNEKEIRDMIDFYKTETGRKTLKKLPALLQKGAQIGQNRVQENMHELQKMIEARQKELNDSPND